MKRLADPLDAVFAHLEQTLESREDEPAPEPPRPSRRLSLADYRVIHEAHDAALHKASRFLAEWNHNLALLGQSGAGKTHLARCILGQARRLRPSASCRFVTWRQHMDAVHQRDDTHKWSVENADLLIVDDIGDSHRYDFARGELLELINLREGKPTVWTSNLTLADLGEQIDARIASRLPRGNNDVMEFLDCPDFGMIPPASVGNGNPTTAPAGANDCPG